ncbi:phage major capsid protein [Pseudomonas sp. Ga0074129]|uniref:phage major capsid protein n=1 Tax=Pseudomonas sp. Ga0074129 TaxID=1752219 RepID=UPI000ADECCCD|nr:phage major capsid protein [Pseudomonas sp. Ga0074129]
MSTEVIKAVQEHADAVNAFKGDVTKQLEEVRGQYSRLWDSMADLAQKGSSGGMFMSLENSPASVADSFIKSDQLKAMLNGAPGTGRVEIASSKAYQKAAVTNTSYGTQAIRDTNLHNNPQRPLSLLDSMVSLKVAGSSFEYVRLNGYTNAAAVQVAEGDAKAEASVASQLVTANISTIAHWTRASLQVLSDAPALTQQLDNLLSYGVRAKLENELLNGPGGTGRIHGLVPQATAFTPTVGAKPADAIGEAKTALEAAGWMPSLIVMNPADWFAIASERADSGDGQYVLGSPRDPSGPSLWGVPVVTTPSLATGTTLVLDAGQVALLDRENVTVMASREDGTNFTTNMVTLLAEMRAGLAVFSAGAVLKIVA